ncbi:unnamed protein product [Gongylonema pulchrum]|uniref:C2 NT-type domain-containing protein n=1 Tax=Gongylonema pulchrum TaxID=637853 RepID=A0A183EB29_9BILA|nr:unnamed protein product [Gongylonema pulchrum]
MSESEESESSSSGVRNVGVSVSRDTGTKVDLILRIDGLRRRRNFFASLVCAFKKPSDPSKMCSNATFTMFNLTSSSLQFSVDVQSERQRKRKKGNANRVDTYTCFIRKFPTSVNPDSAEFEVVWLFGLTVQKSQLLLRRNHTPSAAVDDHLSEHNKWVAVFFRLAYKLDRTSLATVAVCVGYDEV